MAPRYWGMEVLRMGCYVAFPVALFHYFNNSSETLEEDMKAYKDKLSWPGAKEKDEEARKAMAQLRQEQMERLLQKH